MAWQVRDEVKLKAGYRHISVHGKSGTPNHTLLDGAYLGAALQF
ncbi:YfaZ family outer membrane protein [Enterobacter cloacae]|nr:YfaZ family outer membrane protein [Enterobacter cloacae]